MQENYAFCRGTFFSQALKAGLWPGIGGCSYTECKGENVSCALSQNPVGGRYPMRPCANAASPGGYGPLWEELCTELWLGLDQLADMVDGLEAGSYQEVYDQASALAGWMAPSLATFLVQQGRGALSTASSVRRHMSCFNGI